MPRVRMDEMMDDMVSIPAAGGRVRYVVLEHTDVAAPHFDLMVQAPGEEKLATWRLPVGPAAWPAKGERIADHRGLYMTYEGDIAGGRGRVRRVAAGEAMVLGVDHGSVRLGLSGDVRCELELPVYIDGP